MLSKGIHLGSSCQPGVATKPGLFCLSFPPRPTLDYQTSLEQLKFWDSVSVNHHLRCHNTHKPWDYWNLMKMFQKPEPLFLYYMMFRGYTSLAYCVLDKQHLLPQQAECYQESHTLLKRWISPAAPNRTTEYTVAHTTFRALLLYLAVNPAEVHGKMKNNTLEKWQFLWSFKFSNKIAQNWDLLEDSIKRLTTREHPCICKLLNR